jgi:hypothetical protein
MKRLLILTLIMATISAPAAPAAAKPPNCDETPWHPACGGANDEPAMAGHECVGYVTDAYTAAEDSGHFEFDLGGEYYDACIDVSNVDPEGHWTITYNVTAGTLRELLVLVRDSFSPGDICNYGLRFRHVSSGSFTLEPNAADDVNSCGTNFAEMIGSGYYPDFEAIRSPLAFLVFTRGTKDLVVNFTVDYPYAAPTT